MSMVQKRWIMSENIELLKGDKSFFTVIHLQLQITMQWLTIQQYTPQIAHVIW